MRRIIAAIGVLGLVLVLSIKAIGASPLQPWFEDWLSSDSERTVRNLGKGVKRTGHGKYKFANQGGGTVGTPIALGVTLPATALVSRAYYYVTTALAATNAQYGDTNTAQIGCSSGAHFKAASNLVGATSSGGFVEGIQTGTAATMTSSSTTCAVSLNVASHPLTAGELDFFIEYVMPL